MERKADYRDAALYMDFKSDKRAELLAAVDETVWQERRAAHKRQSKYRYPQLYVFFLASSAIFSFTVSSFIGAGAKYMQQHVDARSAPIGDGWALWRHMYTSDIRSTADDALEILVTLMGMRRNSMSLVDF